MEWLGAADVTELQRRWTSVAPTVPLEQGASAGSKPVPAVLRLGHGAMARTLRCEINAVDHGGGWVVVLRADDDTESEALRLANDAIVAPLLAGKMVHDVRGGMAEATMAVASVQTVLQSAQQNTAGLDKLSIVSERLRYVLAGCARGSAALDAWASALGAPAAALDPRDVDLRKILLALPSLLQLPALMRMVQCDVTAGDAPRWNPGNESRVRAALVGLGQHLIAGAAEGAHFTCQFVAAAPGVHTIEMAVDRCDGEDGDDDISPFAGAAREPIALRAADAAIVACGGAVTRLVLRKDEGVRFRVTLPAAVVPEAQRDR